jgi:hypothetical protein
MIQSKKNQMTCKTSTSLVFFANVALALSMLSTLSSCNSDVATTERKAEIFSKFFPSATDTKQILVSEDILTSVNLRKPKASQIRGPTGLLGYCVESEVVSRSGPFGIRVLLDSQLYVRQATILSYPWQRGRDVQKHAFTRQFEGKGIGDPIQVGRDIDAVTGATISSRVMTDGVRESIILGKVLKEKYPHE